MLWNLECPVGFSQKKEYVRISNEGNWVQLWTVRQKVKGNYVMILEF